MRAGRAYQYCLIARGDHLDNHAEDVVARSILAHQARSNAEAVGLLFAQFVQPLILGDDRSIIAGLCPMK